MKLKNAELTKKYESIQNQYENMKSQNDFLRNSLDQYKNLHMEIQTLKANYEALKIDNGNLHLALSDKDEQKHYYELKKERDTLYSIYEKLRTHINEWVSYTIGNTPEELLKNLDSELYGMESDRDRLKEKCDNLEKKLDRINNAVNGGYCSN